MGKKILQVAFTLIAMLAVTMTPAFAEKLSDDPGYQDIYKKSEALKGQPSMDATPVEFSIGDVRYKVPRNYIATMDNYNGGPQTLVAFKVSFPGFKPYTEETTACFSLAPAYRPQGCIPITFNVIGSTPVSDDEAFHNASKLFHSQTPKQGPNGFEWYETGPDNARLDTYRKFVNGHTLMIHCFDNDINKRLKWVCTTSSRLPSNNAIEYILNGREYFFGGEQFKYAEQIDGGLRSLIDSFTIKGDKP